MGTCNLCGQQAGVFLSEHSECRQRVQSGITEMRTLATVAATTGLGYDDLVARLATAAEANRISKSEIRLSLIEGWRAALQTALDSAGLSEEEDRRLVEYAKRFALGQDDLSTNRGYDHFVQGRILRRIINGQFPSDITIKLDGRLPVVLQKSERLIWRFGGAEYHKEVVRREWEGGSTGYSMRVAKGLYIRQSYFKGRPIERREMALQDRGVVVVTDKNLYFSGPSVNFRLPYKRIVAVRPYADGVGIHRDLASAKAETFVVQDGWFISNLLENLVTEPDLVDPPLS